MAIHGSRVNFLAGAWVWRRWVNELHFFTYARTQTVENNDFESIAQLVVCVCTIVLSKCKQEIGGKQTARTMDPIKSLSHCFLFATTEHYMVCSVDCVNRTTQSVAEGDEFISHKLSHSEQLWQLHDDTHNKLSLMESNFEIVYWLYYFLVISIANKKKKSRRSTFDAGRLLAHVWYCTHIILSISSNSLYFFLFLFSLCSMYHRYYVRHTGHATYSILLVNNLTFTHSPVKSKANTQIFCRMGTHTHSGRSVNCKCLFIYWIVIMKPHNVRYALHIASHWHMSVGHLNVLVS